jgi:MFS family permease
MSRPVSPWLVLLAAIAAIEGIGLVAYAIFDIVQGLRVGLTGPQEVSNLPALLLQIVIFSVLGVAGLAIAWGWWRAKYAARAPFILGQLLGLVVGVPIAQNLETTQRVVGTGLVVFAVVGIVVSLLPPVTRAIVPADETGRAKG